MRWSEQQNPVRVHWVLNNTITDEEKTFPKKSVPKSVPKSFHKKCPKKCPIQPLWYPRCSDGILKCEQFIYTCVFIFLDMWHWFNYFSSLQFFFRAYMYAFICWHIFVGPRSLTCPHTSYLFLFLNASSYTQKLKKYP